MKCGELTVRVADSNGIPLEEYQNDGDLVQSELVSSAFIEVPAADQDQSFSIKYSFPPGYKFENARGIIVSLHFALSPVSDRGVESCIILDTKEGVFSKNHYQFEALSIGSIRGANIAVFILLTIIYRGTATINKRKDEC